MSLQRPCLIALLALPLLVIHPGAQGGPGGFRSGDLYLLTPTYTGISSSDGAVLHIDPIDGTVTQLVDIQSVASNPGVMTYDPYRDRMLFNAGLAPGVSELFSMDAAGGLVSLGYSSGVQLSRMTPRGDGIVYMTNNQDGSISYLDAADQLQVVMDATGTAPYAFPIGTPNIRRMHYHAPTNALFCLLTSGVGSCAGGASLELILHKLTLSTDGSRVVMEECTQHDITSVFVSEEAVGLSSGPDGDLLASAAINDSGAFSLLLRVDPEMLTVTSFATPDFLGSNSPATSCYSQVRDRAVLMDDWTSTLRAYDQGESGAGTLIASGVGVGGSATTLVEIGPTRPLYGLSTDTTSISLSAGGTQALELDLGAPHAGETYFVLGSLSGWNPGLDAAGLLLPLNPDAYFNYTVGHPNTGVLVSTLGLLSGGGQAGAALAIPPGATPSLAGSVAHHAAIAWGPGLSFKITTNAVAVSLLP